MIKRPTQIWFGCRYCMRMFREKRDRNAHKRSHYYTPTGSPFEIPSQTLPSTTKRKRTESSDSEYESFTSDHTWSSEIPEDVFRDIAINTSPQEHTEGQESSEILKPKGLKRKRYGISEEDEDEDEEVQTPNGQGSTDMPSSTPSRVISVGVSQKLRYDLRW